MQPWLRTTLLALAVSAFSLSSAAADYLPTFCCGTGSKGGPYSTYGGFNGNYDFRGP